MSPLQFRDSKPLSKWKLLSICASVVVVLIGAAALLGWIFALPGFETFWLGTKMKVTSAIAFIAAGSALLLTIHARSPRTAIALAIFLLPIGGLTLSQDSFRIAIAFVLTGIALLCKRSQIVITQICAVLVGTIALQALIGYSYGVRVFYQPIGLTSMALNSAIALIAVAIALLCLEPDQGLMQPITSPLVGGIVARRILVAVFIAPLCLGWMVLQGWRFGWYDPAFAISLLVLMLVTIAALFIWKTAAILNREDHQRRRAELQLKEALENLRDRENRISRLAEANIIGILFGNVDGGIYRANDELLRIIGYSRHELETGQISWVDITPPEFLPLDELHIAEAQARGACTPYEKEYIRRDSQRVPVLVGYVLLGEARRDSIAFIVDLSDRKRLENSLRQRTQELERANRLKDEFLAVLSHELRTPLNPIIGWTQMLKSKRLDESKTERALETIERNAKLQITLIDDLLDISRILLGKMKLRTEPTDFVKVVEAAIDTVHLAAEAKAITIHFQHDQYPVTIRGDRDRMQQVVWNLLSNSVKFTPVSGKITIQLATSQTDAKLTVSDTGQGIGASFLPYVFDNFRQEDGSSTRSFGGLGLGLAIVKHLVESHGGRIQAHSPGEGKGATFTVELPLLIRSS